MTGVNSAITSAMDRGCYNAAINEISTSADENFSFGGVLNTGNPFALSGPELAEWQVTFIRVYCISGIIDLYVYNKVYTRGSQENQSRNMLIQYSP